MMRIKSGFRPARVAAVVLLVCGLPGSGVRAQPAPDAADGAALHALRIPASEAPAIDGDLSDPVWAKATPIDRFFQIEPDNGAAPTQRTILYIAYDKGNLYFGIHAYDSEPSRIVASYMARDAQIFHDDHVRIALDPNRTHRDAYDFQINPLGGYVDGLIQNNRDFLMAWNPIWRHAAKLTSDGWTAEMAIPFRSVSYDPDDTVWGISFTRVIQRNNERDRLELTAVNVMPNDMRTESSLAGLEGMSQGMGLKVEVYGWGRYTKNWTTRRGGITSHQGGNIYYNITPSLTGTVTINTDFSETPLDKRQVNTTRFSLFTPETRQFFLQDAAAFEFGGSSFSDRNIFGSALDNGKPFFSRNIGLVEGDLAGILAGGKLSGSIGPVDVGGLSVRTLPTGTTKGQLLSVARLSVPVLSESKLGLIVTNGDPTGMTANSVTGGDFQYFNANVFPGKRLGADFFFLQSFSSQFGSDSEAGAALRYPNEPLGGSFYFKHLGENFAPALGFANRVGIDSYRGNLRYRKRIQNSYFRWMETGTHDTLITGLDGTAQSRENTLWVNASNITGDELTIEGTNSFENVPVAFTLPGNLLVPAGRYSWNHIHPRFQSGNSRLLGLDMELDCCSYYNGSYLMADSTINWRLSRTFTLAFEHTMNLINMPTGKTNIQIGQVTADINFTPDMQVSTQIQYDNITDHFQVLARYHWQYSPGQEIFASLGESSLIEGLLTAPYYHPQQTQAEIRIGHTFLF